MITIINYGSGNINAISNIYERLKIPFTIASIPDHVTGAEKIILPGVGAFDETMIMLEETGFRVVLDHEVLTNHVPVLGICVGMQILAKKSEEGIREGLGWIDGEVKILDKQIIPSKPRLPHLGWNSVKIAGMNGLFADIDEEQGFYFLHSFYFECYDACDMSSTTEYGKSFASSVHHKNIYGVQFHPEKSHMNGMNLLKNFASI